LSLHQNADTRYTETLTSPGISRSNPAAKQQCHFRRELFYCKEEQSRDFSSLPRSALAGLPPASAKSGSHRGKVRQSALHLFL